MNSYSYSSIDDTRNNQFRIKQQLDDTDLETPVKTSEEAEEEVGIEKKIKGTA